jgi:hypothetical protein
MTLYRIKHYTARDSFVLQCSICHQQFNDSPFSLTDLVQQVVQALIVLG